MVIKKVVSLKSLLIVKPLALNDGSLGRIIQAIEEKGLIIIGVKIERLDVCGLGKRIRVEKSVEKKKAFADQLNVPCVLIAVQGKNAVEDVKRIEEKFFGLIHVSSGEEIAKYELKRFFKKEELFLREKIIDWVD